ncbi:MAG TPA: hypothetical protein PLX89_18465, partial [Verrucomicrobiota bacterium]|nr:hypothetical protein [Verrucomicrobiota bacterium]
MNRGSEPRSRWREEALTSEARESLSDGRFPATVRKEECASFPPPLRRFMGEFLRPQSDAHRDHEPRGGHVECG